MPQAKAFDGVALLSAGDAILMMWREAARVHRTRWLFEQIDLAVAANPGGIVLIQLVLPTSSPPDAPARAANHARLQKIGGSLRRMVTVPLGDALWMTLVRTVMRGLAIITGHGKSQFVASTEAEGIDILLQAASPATPSRKELAAGLDQLYRVLEVPRSPDSRSPV